MDEKMSDIDNLLIALEIIKRNSDGYPPGEYIAAEHDQIWCGTYSEDIPEADLTTLRGLGWFEDVGAWSLYV